MKKILKGFVRIYLSIGVLITAFSIPLMNLILEDIVIVYIYWVCTIVGLVLFFNSDKILD
jgi:hypothetical protein